MDKKYTIRLLQELENNLFRSGNPSHFELWANRKPLLLLRLSGLLLLRLDTRQFLALLFQLPPRKTRLEPSIIPQYFGSATNVHFYSLGAFVYP
ncbi:MAG: hypothetical protein ACI9JY_003168, partial [Saprospiraceae bacterium]